MNIIMFIAIGLIAGWIAGMIVKDHGFGTGGNILVGIVGAFVGGILFDVFNLQAYGFGGAVALATLGAMVFLFIGSLFPRVTGPTNQAPHI